MLTCSILHLRPHCQYPEGLSLFLVGDAGGSLAKRDGPDVEFLNLIDRPNHQRRVVAESKAG